MIKVPSVIMRGGTSKALFFHAKDMPPKEKWDAFLLDAMGSPDVNQIDGMGGANSLTSKVAIIAPVEGEAYSLDYTLAQVSVTEARVFWNGNCGNISSAVAPFAVDEGLVPAQEPLTVVRFRNTNTNKILEAHIEVKDGRFNPEGDCHIPGVPHPGSPVRMFFVGPEGAVTGKLLPTGNAVDVLPTSRGAVPVSIVDAANPLVFMRAESVGHLGSELPDEFAPDQLVFLEEIRSIAAELGGFAPRDKATELSPDVPKTTLIAPPMDYVSLGGEPVRAADMDICVRMVVMGKPHKAIALTGAVCTSVASLTADTLVASLSAAKKGVLRIGHAGGVMHVPVERTPEGPVKAGALRTARRLAEGFIFTRKDHF
ncbi:hypothetical protein LJC26_02230 [Desulfovibrio sp. OttesenSCG-928-O18]|nr:hypothetical protein [Desulfovibrio sp. OttesenSCG-928-O18]